eukprot:GHVU01042885.1.p1 GENE.GHVU01042885.1~~GHVU01042885.1.p1  ORF type:complete len:175 (+),score=27.41 GHVU01042885.1:2-526(+)
MPPSLAAVCQEALMLAENMNAMECNMNPSPASRRIDAIERIVSEWLDVARAQWECMIVRMMESGSSDKWVLTERVGKLTALQRDGFKSVISGHMRLNKPDAIHCHHIVARSCHDSRIRPKNIHDPRNLITLTGEEHATIHREGWRKHAPELFRLIGQEEMAARVEKYQAPPGEE